MHALFHKTLLQTDGHLQPAGQGFSGRHLRDDHRPQPRNERLIVSVVRFAKQGGVRSAAALRARRCGWLSRSTPVGSTQEDAGTDAHHERSRAEDEQVDDGKMNGVVSLWSLAHAEPPQQAPCSTGGNLRRGAEFKHPCGPPFGFVSKKWNHFLPRRYHHGTTNE